MGVSEQRVRTMCGWVGVEISKSRVRTEGKAGFGLYRARGSSMEMWLTPGPVRFTPRVTWGEWTPYAFTLDEIETEVKTAIWVGIPAAPSDLWLRPDDGGSPVGVTTRWTGSYRGSRNLGAEAGGDLPVGALVERSTVRTRQRAQNDEFQREHLKRRAYGLEARKRARLAHNASVSNSGLAAKGLEPPAG